MLSPFRGVMHTVATRWADAATIDGRNWTLYVRGECLYDDLDGVDNSAVSVPDVKYGSWSSANGFQRAPIRMPTFDVRVSAEGENLLEAVRRHADDLPFALADRFELWLLHAATRRPLALIASACSELDCRDSPPPRWTPGQACMAESAAARTLFARVAELAGGQPLARWYERCVDGSGKPPGEGATAFDADAFPRLLIDRRALDADQRPLLDALLHWQSPALLQLPDLSVAERTHLEAAACRHAVRVAEQLPLYPCVLDEAAITAALVEARLRRTLPTTSTAADEPMLSPDYVEIPD